MAKPGGEARLAVVPPELSRAFGHMAERHAACNIGGVSVHSFAGIGLGTQSVDDLVTKAANRRAHPPIGPCACTHTRSHTHAYTHADALRRAQRSHAEMNTSRTCGRTSHSTFGTNAETFSSDANVVCRSKRTSRRANGG